ncbi:MAG: 3-hydroxyacyl-CoA dehydrogenase, partial [Alphaproteobacteria bacterium]
GGIMYHADQVGLPKVLARVEEFHAAHGKLWQPSALLRDLAGSGGSFTGA